MYTLGRRGALAGASFLLAQLWARSAGAAPLGAADLADWCEFKERFVMANGRVIDTGNGGESHSAGQGASMLFAQRCDDQETFQRLRAWTARVLRRQSDSLSAWHCLPGPAEQVDDRNNATDGDLLIAWALLEAGARWSDPALTQSGTSIAADILRLLMRETAGRHLLMPAAIGFDHEDQLVVNPSYYVFPAFLVLAAACPDPAWVQIAADGLELLRAARFGHWALPPDWVSVARTPGSVRPAPDWPQRFSYDAVRVPLYMVWAGLHKEPAVLGAAAFWSDPMIRPWPSWVNLETDSASTDHASAGTEAVALLTLKGTGRSRVAHLPRVSKATDYYSAVLVLLCRLAWADRGLSTE